MSFAICVLLKTARGVNSIISAKSLNLRNNVCNNFMRTADFYIYAIIEITLKDRSNTLGYFYTVLLLLNKYFIAENLS